MIPLVFIGWQSYLFLFFTNAYKGLLQFIKISHFEHFFSFAPTTTYGFLIELGFSLDLAKACLVNYHIVFALKQ